MKRTRFSSGKNVEVNVTPCDPSDFIACGRLCTLVCHFITEVFVWLVMKVYGGSLLFK